MNERVNETNEETTTIADSAQEAFESLRHHAGSDWSDWSLLDDSGFQNLKERVEHLEGATSLGPLTELRDRVDKLEAEPSPSSAAGESNRIQEMIEDLTGGLVIRKRKEKEERKEQEQAMLDGPGTMQARGTLKAGPTKVVSQSLSQKRS